jgi:hypothetical protein
VQEIIKESDVRKYFYFRLPQGWKAEKFVSPSNRDVPDELVTAPLGQMFLVELKRPGGKLRPGQLRDHAERARLGVRVAVLSSYEAVDLWYATWSR